jgi:hypothetical protein
MPFVSSIYKLVPEIKCYTIKRYVTMRGVRIRQQEARPVQLVCYVHDLFVDIRCK